MSLIASGQVIFRGYCFGRTELGLVFSILRNIAKLIDTKTILQFYLANRLLPLADGVNRSCNKLEKAI